MSISTTPNASSIFPPAKFEHIRPPLVSLALLPSVRLAALGAAGNTGYFVLPHLTAVVISLLSALAIGLMLRRHLGTTLALSGIAFFATSRLFIRYGPFVMADLLSAGSVASVLAVYMRTWIDGEDLPKWRDYRLCGLLLGAALLTKQPLGLILPALALSEILHVIHFKRWQRRRLLGLVVTIAVGILVFLSVELLIFTWLYGADGLEAAAYSAKYDFHPRSVSNRLAVSSVGDSNWNYATLAWHTLSPPVILAGVVGLVLALKQRQNARSAIPGLVGRPGWDNHLPA
jgi:4-amino-4-deoxy-L-arabinose transferase-like glycosyltransferase